MNAAMSDTLVSVLSSVATAAIPIIGYFVTAALQKFAKNRGIEIQQKNLDRVDQFLVNGLNLAASEVKATRGMPAADAKKILVNGAIAYLNKHGTDTLNEMSADLSDPKVQEAMRARIETLITDPTKPTPAILSPDKASVVVAPVAST